MKGLPFVLLFTAMTFIAWGAYGPTLHHGAVALHHDSLRAFVGVGLAYFLIAVIIPFLILKKSGETGRWTVSGAVYSLIAGAVGAVGALGIIMALGYGGATIYVMPLVFGFAPIVNTLVTAYLSKTFHEISPVFIAGVVTAALGAGGVLVFKPGPAKAAAKPAVMASSERSAAGEPSMEELDAASVVTEKPTELNPKSTSDDALSEVDSSKIAADEDLPSSEAPESSEASEENESEAGRSEAGKSEVSDQPHAAPAAKVVNYIGVLASIVLAAVCWGSYGPMLHIGQGKMSGSRLRPFACVGMAYFFIAVAAPLVLIYSRSGNVLGGWTSAGLLWSFIAGVAGAVGALGVILAFNAGGKPYYVMPLIFGFAPVINTFISLSEAGTWSLVPIAFWVSLAVVILGAVTVLTNAPKPKPKPKPAG